MNFISTRDKNIKVSSAMAIKRGISVEGGLFVPETMPNFTLSEIDALKSLKYSDRAFEILKKYLVDFTEDELKHCTDSAYSIEKFGSSDAAPLKKIDENFFSLELWHGPTCAFKDMALQILPYFLTTSMKKTNEDKTVVILVATSGDTGKAALEGFKDVKGTKILVYYPCDGVSNMQKLQMQTQEGENVDVCAIKGNFDDAQSAVKEIFTNNDIKNDLESKGFTFSSANSINFGRLCPQIVYYFSAYCDLLNKGEIKLGDKINICVPTGNFGNILAAYYAKLAGLPVNKLICASNKNNVLTDFINTGIYDKNRDFYATSSPSMDILISSNLERLLYFLTSNDDKKVTTWMNDLSEKGKYEVDENTFKALKESFECGFANEDDTLNTIKNTFLKYNYLCDTHTAVAFSVYNDYVNKTKDNTKTIIASTASPYKFPDDVLKAIDNVEVKDDFELIECLSEKTNTVIPEPIAELKDKTLRFSDVVSKEDMARKVYSALEK